MASRVSFTGPRLGRSLRSEAARRRRAAWIWLRLLRRGVLLFEPESGPQAVKQIGAFGKSVLDHKERRLVTFERGQQALESFQRSADLGDRAGLGRFAHDQQSRLEIVHLLAIALVEGREGRISRLRAPGA